jgi:hypothetical protein
MMLQHHVIAVACSSISNAGKSFCPWRETFYITPCRKSLAPIAWDLVPDLLDLCKL